MESDDRDDVSLVNSTMKQTEQLSIKPCFPYRYQLLILTCCGLLSGFTIRTTFNIALVDMVNYTSTNNYTSDECVEPNQPVANHSSKEHDGEFSWDSNMQSLLLGAFFYGYILTQFIGGYIAEVTGPKRILCVTILVPGILSMASPWMARWSPIALFVTRFLMGVAQGPMWPVNQCMWSRWVPASEFSMAFALTTAGSTLGTFVGPVLTGILCDLSFRGGWPLSFYIFGLSGILWSFLWLCFAYNRPDENPKLTLYERQVIQRGKSFSTKDTNVKRPLRAMLTSKCVWGLMIYYLFDGLSYYSIYSGVPIFMKQILKYDIAENGFMNSLPYIGMMITNVIGGFAADWLRKNHLSTKTTRKLFCLIGEGSQCLCVLGIALWPCSRLLVVTMYTVGLSIGGLSVSGATVNWLDIAPKYSGTLMGVSNLIGNIGGFVSPLLIGLITKDSPRRSDWQIVFYITTGFYAIATLTFMILGEGEEQPWAKDDNMTEPLVYAVNSPYPNPSVNEQVTDKTEENTDSENDTYY